LTHIFLDCFPDVCDAILWNQRLSFSFVGVKGFIEIGTHQNLEGNREFIVLFDVNKIKFAQQLTFWSFSSFATDFTFLLLFISNTSKDDKSSFKSFIYLLNFLNWSKICDFCEETINLFISIHFHVNILRLVQLRDSLWTILLL
jgi:hypothetical protein